MFLGGFTWEQECRRHAPLGSLRQRTHACTAMGVHHHVQQWLTRTHTYTHEGITARACTTIYTNISIWPTHTNTHTHNLLVVALSHHIVDCSIIFLPCLVSMIMCGGSEESNKMQKVTTQVQKLQQNNCILICDSSYMSHLHDKGWCTRHSYLIK